MDALKVQILPEHQSSPLSTYTLANPKSNPTKSLIMLLIIASVAVTLGLLYVSNSSSALVSRRLLCPRTSLRYSVVIDAGSSGTRVHVFAYWFDQYGEPVFDFGEKHYADMKLTPGLSAYVTFVSSEHVPPEFSRTIAYKNVSYTIYSHSFLHYGKDAALKRLLESLQNLAANSTGDGIVDDPCTPKGYIYDTSSQKYSSGFLADESKLKGSLQAAGNFSKCRSATFALLQEGKENCLYEHCSIGSTFTPDLQGSFLATSNFYYSAEFFELKAKGWLSELIPAGKKYCGEEWSKLKLEYPTTEEEFLRGYCFSSAYIISMLHDSLGIALDDERIAYASNAGEKHIPLDWALGAFILDTVTPTSYNNGGKSRKYLGLF
ncbi:PREDICTED: probable apyrase 3 [Camelina sativa]|uniref:apyrase n=1 Tax=Camelina sativa TaxID=90675 RepID=A0ABM0VXT4_CAMSA|nr:PREDICTED: probable apyrase 3 [Camelina sativa]